MNEERIDPTTLCWKCKQGNINSDDAVIIVYKVNKSKHYFHGSCFANLSKDEMHQLQQYRQDLALSYV